ncbi:MAG: TRAP transporter small permease subunit [Rhodobacteraceae bacterium]|nr:TRAP transporter small permease subunit [Paracoccaceae bacterium]
MLSITDPGEANRDEQNRFDRISVHVSNAFAWLFPILMVAICMQVVLRSLGHNQAWLDDLQWWLYGSASLIAIGYAVTTDRHVRVDIFQEHFPADKKNQYEIFALVWLLLPFVILTWDVTVPYAIQSVMSDEGSDSPNGLHNLWILKVFMNLAFLFIGFAVWSAYVRFLAQLVRPALWRQALYAFPSTIFMVNLVIYYGIWWYYRLTVPSEVTNREISRLPLFETFAIGPEEMKYTVLFAIIGTVILIGGLWLMDRRNEVET